MNTMKSSMNRMIAVLAIALVFVAATPASAGILVPSDGVPGLSFGSSVSLSDDEATGLVGAYGRGAAYFYRNLDTASGTVNEHSKLRASDGAGGDYFGETVSLSGTTGLVGADYHDTDGNTYQGAAYLYRGLDSASGTVTQNAKLISSEGAARDYFGSSVSLSDDATIGLVGARGRGAAYLYRDLDTATGEVTENAKLISSDGGASNYFGQAASLSGTTGLVGAQGLGAAYLYRGLDTANGDVTENAKLISSEGTSDDFFGSSVSLSDDEATGLVGASRHHTGGNSDQGAAYLYRNLDSASDTVDETAKLISSDGAADDYFGETVSLSSATGLVGARAHDIGGNTNQGAAYLYRDLNSASGTETEDVKLWASDGAADDNFGYDASLDGDLFTIGSRAEKAYTGTVSSMTTLDDGSTQVTDGISFESSDDWIIGQNNSNNQVTLSAGDSADVTESGMAVYVGQNYTSNDNTLVVDGDLTANTVQVGTGYNTGNTLTGSGTITGIVINEGIIAPGNSPGTLTIDGDVSGNGDYIMEIASASSYDQLDVTGAVDFYGSVIDVNLLGGYAPGIGDTFTLFSAGSLAVHGSYSFDFADAGGAAAWDTSNFLTTGQITSTVPEPTTMGLLSIGGLALLKRRRSRQA